MQGGKAVAVYEGGKNYLSPPSSNMDSYTIRGIAGAVSGNSISCITSGVLPIQ